MDLWSDYAATGQAAQTAAITDQSAERYGEVPSAAPSSGAKVASVHSSGYPTNSAASPADKAILNKAVIIVAAAFVLLILEGAIVFRSHNL